MHMVLLSLVIFSSDIFEAAASVTGYPLCTYACKGSVIRRCFDTNNSAPPVHVLCSPEGVQSEGSPVCIFSPLKECLQQDCSYGMGGKDGHSLSPMCARTYKQTRRPRIEPYMGLSNLAHPTLNAAEHLGSSTRGLSLEHNVELHDPMGGGKPISLAYRVTHCLEKEIINLDLVAEISVLACGLSMMEIHVADTQTLSLLADKLNQADRGLSPIVT